MGVSVLESLALLSGTVLFNVSDAEQEADAGVCAERESVARGPHIPHWTRERDGAVGCIVSSRVVGMTTEPP